LFAADVYGGSASNGSAVAIVRAMGWLASAHVRVVTISLVGPANPLLQAGVKALQAKGIAVVAAVGNDGPAAPPQYPASYPGVIAVTGVDSSGRALIEAGKPLHLDFAAPGADMVGAVPGGGWERLRGTSFAAPLVAASLARLGSLDALAASAKPGRGRVGQGIVCADCATAPKAVGLK
jgi:subtilisin family serine protease